MTTARVIKEIVPGDPINAIKVKQENAEKQKQKKTCTPTTPIISSPDPLTTYMAIDGMSKIADAAATGQDGCCSDCGCSDCNCNNLDCGGMSCSIV